MLMKQEETLILRESDKGNQIQFIFNDLSSITSAEFRLIKPDETFVISTGEIDTENNIITIDINEQCCTVPGKGRFNIRLIGTDINVYTYVGRCIIDINLDLENAVESTAEANGYTFPDDFLTSADLSNYATKNYVDTAVEHVPVYTPINYSFVEQKTGRKWIDGKDEYEKTIVFENAITISQNEWTNLNVVSTGIDQILNCHACDIGVAWGCINISTTVNSGYLSALTTRNGDSINVKYLTIHYTKLS